MPKPTPAGWQSPTRRQILHATAGAAAFEALGIDIDAVRALRRRFAFGCLDWSERRAHLGGVTAADTARQPAGRARSVAAPLVKRGTNTRTFRFTGPLPFIAGVLEQHHIGLEEADTGRHRGRGPSPRPPLRIDSERWCRPSEVIGEGARDT